ncbi:MAG: hypothetical protein J5I90_15750 [Caldilineales bacterium]|nr:hypothetical protein [Caldilineales bacterium]
MIRKTIIVRAIIILAVLSLASSIVFSQSGGSYELTWASIKGGGGEMTGGDYSLVSSIAQPEPGDTQSGGGYSLNGGVVDAGRSGQSTPGGTKVYAPMILR